MPSIDALILGLVQGLTEFLPISSSGHLVIASDLLGYHSPGLVLEAAAHLATALVIVVYFRHRFAALCRGLFRDADSRRPTLALSLALAATGVVALALLPSVSGAFSSPSTVGAMWLATGAALLSLRFAPRLDSPRPLSGISWRVALLVGALQGVATLPGISRSGITIAAGLWAGQSRASAAEFSFLLAVPAILAASLLSIFQSPFPGSANPWDVLSAFAVAFVSGLAAIHWLMGWVLSGRMWWFGIYCLLAGGATMAHWKLFPLLL